MNVFSNNLLKLLLFACCLGIVFSSCDKSDDFNNKNGFSNQGIPSNLTVKNLGFSAQLTWEQNNSNIDGFKLEKSRDSITWILLKVLNPDIYEYNDSTFELGLTFYRIRSFEGNNQSKNCHASINATCYCDESRFGTFTDSRDGHKYRTIKIGNQTWMAENLAYLPRVNTVRSGGQFTNDIPNYWVYAYEKFDTTGAKKTDNYKNYGVLYNWASAKISCPTGWHLPSKDEWNTLKDYLYQNLDKDNDKIGGTNIAKTMASSYGWRQSDTIGSIGNIQLKNNKSCFSLFPGGYYSLGYDKYSGKGEYGYWGSSTCEKNRNGEDIGVSVYVLNYKERNIQIWSFKKYDSFSIRCVKD